MYRFRTHNDSLVAETKAWLISWNNVPRIGILKEVIAGYKKSLAIESSYGCDVTQLRESINILSTRLAEISV